MKEKRKKKEWRIGAVSFFSATAKLLQSTTKNCQLPTYYTTFMIYCSILS